MASLSGVKKIARPEATSGPQEFEQEPERDLSLAEFTLVNERGHEKISREEFLNYKLKNQEWLFSLSEIMRYKLRNRFDRETKLDLDEKGILFQVAANPEQALGAITLFYTTVTADAFTDRAYNSSMYNSKLNKFTTVLREVTEWNDRYRSIPVFDPYVEIPEWTRVAFNSLVEETDFQNHNFFNDKMLALACIIEHRFKLLVNSYAVDCDNNGVKGSYAYSSKYYSYSDDQMLRRLTSTFASIVTASYCHNRLDVESLFNALKNIQTFMSNQISNMSSSFDHAYKALKDNQWFDNSNVVFSSPTALLFSGYVDANNDPF